jgi:hypothetical protein
MLAQPARELEEGHDEHQVEKQLQERRLLRRAGLPQ